MNRSEDHMSIVRHSMVPCHHTMGTMYYVSGSIRAKVCVTLELPWEYNKPSVSCIPSGEYDIRPHPFSDIKVRLVNNRIGVYYDSSRAGKKDRSSIDIAVGNVPSELRGGVALGEYPVCIKSDGDTVEFGLGNSSGALNEFMKFYEDGRDENLSMPLIIEWADLSDWEVIR